MRVLTATLTTLMCSLSACHDGDAGTSEPDVSAVTHSSEDVPKVQALLPRGEYRLAGADGADVNLPHAITVTVSEDTIALASQCVTPRWTYRHEEGLLVTQSIPDPVCERGRYPAEDAAIAVLDSPETILRTPENGWFLAGSGHAITLFSQ